MLRELFGFAAEPVSTRDWRGCGCFRYLRFGQMILDMLTKLKNKFEGNIDSRPATYLEKVQPTTVVQTREVITTCRCSWEETEISRLWGRKNCVGVYIFIP